MLGTSTGRKLGALTLVLALLVTAVGPAAAAVSDVTIVGNSYSVDEDRSQAVDVEVTADSNGISGETLTLNVTDDTGTVVETYSKTIDVAADSTATFTFDVDASSDGADLSPGSYSLDAEAGSVQSGTSDLTVNDVQETSVSWGQSSYDLFLDGGDSRTVEYTVTAGDRDVNSENVTVRVYDPSANAVFETVIEDVSVAAGNTTTDEVTLGSGDVDTTGDHSLGVKVDGASTSSILSVTDPADPAVNADSTSYRLYNASDSVGISATLAAGDYDQTANATVNITDDSGNVVYEATKQDVTVNAGETKTVTFDVEADDINTTGNYTAEVTWEGDSATSDMEVISGEGDEVFAGGAASDAGGVGAVLVGVAALLTVVLAVAAFKD